MSHGDKLFVVSIPAGCADQGIFYNGLQEWVDLVFGSTIRPYVLSQVILASCPRSSAVSVTSPSEGVFEVQLTQHQDSETLVLPQLEIARLKEGDHVGNSFATFTVLEATEARKVSRAGHEWSERRFTQLAIQVHRATLESPGRNHFVFFDGESLWALVHREWRKVAAPATESQYP